MGNWRPSTESLNIPLMAAMTNLLLPREEVDANLLPNLRLSRELVVASDYSGEHIASPFQVLTFLLATGESIHWQWNDARLAIREQFLKDGRRLAFKGLGDESKQKAVVPFLAAADSIDGVLVSVAVDKSIEPFAAMYQFGGWEESGPPWKPDVWEKLLRISAFGSVLIGGLCGPEQPVRWIMDDDATIANDTLANEASGIFGTMLHDTRPQPHGPISFGIAPKFDDERLAEDLVSLCDLAGGATAENHAVLGSGLLPRTSDLFVPIMQHRSTKTQLLTAWLALDNTRLRKITMAVRQHAPGQLLLSIGKPQLRPDMPNFTAPLWVPHDRGWVKSSDWWRPR